MLKLTFWHLELGSVSASVMEPVGLGVIAEALSQVSICKKVA